MSPLDPRVMYLFDTIEENHYQYTMDNIYNSATFFKAVYNHEKKLPTHGVTRKIMRGIPPCIKQEELNSKKANIDIKGTVKKSVLKGDPKITKLIVSSVYDNKPVHYISMVSEELKWFVKYKECFNVDMGKVKN